MRLLFTLAFVLTPFFATCIGVIRAQPYDDSQLRAFLTPPDLCPLPCFMGIRPGAMTVDEAVTLLEAHEWVETTHDNTVVNYRSASVNVSGVILWDWSGLQPPLIDESFSGRLWITRGQVTGMYIGTHIRLGELWRLLGQPDIGLIVRSDTDETYLALIANYTDIPLGVGADWHCPVNATTYWHAPLRIVLPSFTSRDEEFRLAYQRC
jgi:hypothetical protein